MKSLNALSRSVDLIEHGQNIISFKKDFDGKRVLNREIKKLYDKSK